MDYFEMRSNSLAQSCHGLRETIDQAFHLLLDFLSDDFSAQRNMLFVLILVGYYPMLVTGVIMAIMLGSSTATLRGQTGPDLDCPIFTPPGSSSAAKSMPPNHGTTPAEANSYFSRYGSAQSPVQNDQIFASAQKSLCEARKHGLRDKCDVELTLAEINALMGGEWTMCAADCQHVSQRRGEQTSNKRGDYY